MVRYYYLITWSVDPTHTAVGSRSSVFFFLCGFSFLPIAVADLVICAAHPTHAAEIGVTEIFTGTCAGGTKRGKLRSISLSEINRCFRSWRVPISSPLSLPRLSGSVVEDCKYDFCDSLKV